MDRTEPSVPESLDEAVEAFKKRDLSRLGPVANQIMKLRASGYELTEVVAATDRVGVIAAICDLVDHQHVRIIGTSLIAALDEFFVSKQLA